MHCDVARIAKLIIDRIGFDTHVCVRIFQALPHPEGFYVPARRPPFIAQEKNMDRRTSAVALLAAVTLAACSPDVVSPRMAPKSPSFSKSVGESGRHILLVNGAGAKSFAARVAALGGSVVSYHVGAGVAVLSGLSEEAATELAVSGVGDLQPDFEVSIDMPRAAIEADGANISAEINSVANPATAGRFNFQWNMRAISAPAAWAAGKLGSNTVTVAILDTGIDYDATDLNGLVDLSRSKSFMDTFVGRADDPSTPANEASPIVPADDQIISMFFPSRNKIADLNGHGTNVAAQVSSKAAALAGVTSKTTLIGVKVLGANGSGNFSDVLNGVLYAADQGADVANMSLGGGFSKSGSGRTISTINRVFNYARQKGMVVVVAAGNSGFDLQHNANAYSTYCDAPHVICVSSVGATVSGGNPDIPSYFTNYGKNSVDIAAPGGNTGTTASVWPWGNGTSSWVWSYCAKQTLVIVRAPNGVDGQLFSAGCASGGFLTGYIGTSQASPHVAGLAALLVAEYGKGNPARIKQQIQQSADVIDPALGRGRINVARALGL
jgi:hypothetical protein